MRVPLFRWLLCCLAVVGLTGCEFDEDAAFVPRARTAWLVVQDGATQELVRVDVETGALVRNPVTLPGMPQHVTGLGTSVYVTTQGSVTVLDGRSNQVVRRVDVPTGASFSVATADAAYVLNPVRREVQVVFRRNAPDITIAVSFPPEAAVFSTGKVLLAGTQGQARWLNATALTLTQPGNLPQGPVRLQRNNIGRIDVHVLQPDQTLAVRTANPQNEVIPTTGSVEAAVDVWVPLAIRQQFGRELLTSVRRLANGEVRRDEGNLLLASGANSLAVDMEQSYAWVTARDSLLRIDVRTGQRAGGWPMRGVIRSAAFVQAADE